VAKKLKLTDMSTHQLLWNLKAVQNNAIHAPKSMRASCVSECNAVAPRYRTELERRGVKYPKTLDEADWEIALAQALGFSEPRPRKKGTYDRTTGAIGEVVQVWDAQQRRYVTQQ